MLKKSNQDLVGILVLRELEREREECMSKWKQSTRISELIRGVLDEKEMSDATRSYFIDELNDHPRKSGELYNRLRYLDLMIEFAKSEC